jgi:hypothetical protein
VQIYNGHDLENWRVRQAEDVTLMVAARVTLRLLPAVTPLLAMQPLDRSEMIVLQCFRAAAMSSFLGTWPEIEASKMKAEASDVLLWMGRRACGDHGKHHPRCGSWGQGGLCGRLVQRHPGQTRDFRNGGGRGQRIVSDRQRVALGYP